MPTKKPSGPKLPDFNVVPYVGALPVKFEMTRAEVAKLIGPPESTSENFLGNTEEWRGSVNIGYLKNDGKVFHVGFAPNSVVTLNGQKLIDAPDPIAVLLKYDPKPYEIRGSLVFLEIGISLTGYNDGDRGHRAIAIFKKGRWDKYKDQAVLWKKSSKRKT